MSSPIVQVIGYTQPVSHPIPNQLLTTENTQQAIDNAISNVVALKQMAGSDMANIIELAGRTCYDSLGQGRSSQNYHQHIKEVGHGSVCEHASINFYLDNISRGCTHELVRHRAGCAISQRSTRYVDESSSTYILHPLIQKYMDRVTRDSIDGAIVHARSSYDMIVAHLQHILITAGVDKFTARTQARGAARGMLGNALCTSMVWTANVRALRGCIEQRASPHADAEIRVLFNCIYEEAVKICPEYFNDYEKIECPDGIGYGLVTKYKKI